MLHLYILNSDHLAVPVASVEEWGRWFQTADRHIALEAIGPLTVSTVFIGLDHGLDPERPMIFETMIFGIDDDSYQERCSTWTEAIDMHEKAMAHAIAQLALDQ